MATMSSPFCVPYGYFPAQRLPSTKPVKGWDGRTFYPVKDSGGFPKVFTDRKVDYAVVTVYLEEEPSWPHNGEGI